jgi:DNA-binding beta-propeller fold protein YncE
MKNTFIIFLFFLTLTQARASEKPDIAIEDRCDKTEALAILELGMQLQSELESEAALEEYRRCLKIDPQCSGCLYEMGWSHWKLGNWEKVLESWNKILKQNPTHAKVNAYINTARENQKITKGGGKTKTFRTKIAIGTESTPKGAKIEMVLSSRHQSYNPKPDNALDIFDTGVNSPKSVKFSPDGKTVFVNSLEGEKTIAYDRLGFKKLFTLDHRFSASEEFLFEKKPNFGYEFSKDIKNPNQFSGKPVEVEITSDGKTLFVPYYRRSFDSKSIFPSALAVVDVESAKITRVLSTGPIAKYVRISPKEKLLAVSHWGDNTVGLFDISSKKHDDFKSLSLLVVEEQLPLKNVSVDRDRDCGYCIRGLAFSPDDRYLFVSRMRKGGIAVFDLKDLQKPKFLGTVMGINPGPRDLEISKDGEYLYISCNASGYVSKVRPMELVEMLNDKTLNIDTKLRVNFDATKFFLKTLFVGSGARSIELSKDETTLFVAVNQASEVLAIDAETMTIISRVNVDSFPVGLGLSPEGDQLWVTSQGHKGLGGNSVGIYLVREKQKEILQIKKPRKNPSEKIDHGDL